jgi:hypothetical protein
MGGRPASFGMSYELEVDPAAGAGLQVSLDAFPCPAPVPLKPLLSSAHKLADNMHESASRH